MAAIEVRHLYKKFEQKGVTVEALSDINLTVEQGDIYGIIGMSGAGKSTLVRCLNFLEKPTEGQVLIEGQELGALTEKELRGQRSDIAMIFQNFNLLMQKSVLDNVCFPMQIQGKKKKEARERARELLKTVGLSEKEKAYPAQLSGGQRQRVAIARALASDPKILLCDEAIIEHGVLVEDGLVEDIFSHPKSKAAKELILRDQPGNNNAPLAGAVQERMQGDKKIRIVFSENSAFEPVIANMILQFKTPVNILRADTKNVGGVAKGEMILGLPEDRHLQVDIEEYLKGKGLAVEEVTEDVE